MVAATERCLCPSRPSPFKSPSFTGLLFSSHPRRSLSRPLFHPQLALPTPTHRLLSHYPIPFTRLPLTGLHDSNESRYPQVPSIPQPNPNERLTFQGLIPAASSFLRDAVGVGWGGMTPTPSSSGFFLNEAFLPFNGDEERVVCVCVCGVSLSGQPFRVFF